MANRKRLGFSTSTPSRPVKRNRPGSPDREELNNPVMTHSQLVMGALISACRSTLKPHDEKGNHILNKVQKHYERASKDFVNSPAFIERVTELTTKVRHNPATTFVLTRDFFSEIKAYRAQETEEVAEAETGSPVPVNGGNGDDIAEQEAGDSESTTSGRTKSKPSSGQLARLESILTAHHKEIQKLETKELSLDDLDQEDNDYLILERLKKRAAKIYLRLCELKGRSRDMGGTREKKFKYSGSRYGEVNIHVQRFINRHNLEERMPDYSDIRKIIKKCNDKYKYHLNQRRVDDLSKEVFTEVGGILSDLRKKDFMDDFGPSDANRKMKTQTEDPAFYDRRLQETLKKNKVMADQKLKEEFQKWADLDEEMQNKTSKLSDTEEKESDGKEEENGKESVPANDDAENDGDEEESESSSSDEDELLGVDLRAEDADNDDNGDTDIVDKGDNAEEDELEFKSSTPSSNSSSDEGETGIADLSSESDSNTASSPEMQITEDDIVPAMIKEPEVIELISDSD